MNLRNYLPVFIGAFLCFQAPGVSVNRLNGGANVTYVDFSLSSSSVPLELIRSYSSITAANEANGWLGAFGWGWSTAFETTLTTTPERHVILRDGMTGNTLNFKPVKEDPKLRESFFKEVKAKYFESKKGRALSEKELEKVQLPSQMQAKLKSDPSYRVELASKYGVEGAIPKGELLVSTEYGYQTIQFKNNRWIRERDALTQFFDKDGRLIKQADKTGYSFEFQYSPTNKSQLTEIVAQDRTASLRFVFVKEKIVQVSDNRNYKATYAYDEKGNLIQATDSSAQTYNYKYENKRFPHLITRIDYPSEVVSAKPVSRELRYDDNGLVVYHKEKDGTEVTYSYGKMGANPENNFWTRTTKKAAGKTEEQYDEYLIKPRKDGSKYLYRQETKLNSDSTVTIFTECCGKPLQTVKNGVTTNYKYYENGLLKEKVGPKEDVRLEYDSRWSKVSKVIQNGVTSYYEYDAKGNLVRARNSNKANLALKYDRFGRILEMTDPEGKQIKFEYNEAGKPTLIAEKGVGTIKIDYDSEGKIKKTETLANSGKGNRHPSDAQSAEVVRRVMKGFQHLLDIIRPAGVSFAG